ncbi:MAG: glycosyltransferase family 2 protein [Lachnospiraceae bacterium]|nr:glycosyltransferase family 2 protein [Lachnospiraceae bacterium]
MRNEVQVLLSVMDKQDSLHYVDMLNIRTDVLIINQCGTDNEYEQGGRYGNIYVRESKKRGLSISRNEALDNARSDRVILCDNDVRYDDDAFVRINAAFERNPDAGILVFFIERPERHVPVLKKEGPLDRLHSMKVFSPEIAIRRSLTGDLKFDAEFGSGAKYSMGEENIFLFRAMERGIKVIYVPERIATLLPQESGWFTGYNEGFFFDRGAGYEAMDEKHWHFLALQFLLRKRKLYRNEISMAGAWRSMKEGRREYRSGHKKG